MGLLLLIGVLVLGLAIYIFVSIRSIQKSKTELKNLF
jgi:hypothetical protein